jgi:hypothetical protein
VRQRRVVGELDRHRAGLDAQRCGIELQRPARARGEPQQPARRSGRRRRRRGARGGGWRGRLTGCSSRMTRTRRPRPMRTKRWRE